MEETRNCINLVLTVKKYPALYDLKCNDYHNRMVRNKMWKAVAQEVNASAAACKEKWKNLRASFSRHLRNQNTAGEKSKKPYYMADYMDFLLPNTKRRRQMENMNDDTGTQHENWNDIETASDESMIYEKQKTNEIISEIDAGSFIKSNEEDQTDALIKSKIKDDMNCIDRCSINYTATNSSRDLLELNTDADLLFLKSLLPDIRQMSRREKSNFKISVLSLIDQILTSKSTENDIHSPQQDDDQNKNRNLL